MNQFLPERYTSSMKKENQDTKSTVSTFSALSDANRTSLITSEDRFRALVFATSDVVYRMSADWSEMMQLERGDFLSDTGSPITDWMQKYIHPKDQGRVKAAIDEAIRNRSMFQLEHQVLRADGTLGWTFSRAIPILDDEGNISEWFGAANDITARKKTEEALREAKDKSEQQKRLYETITSNTPDLIYVFDLNYRFTYANDALLTMWGMTWDEAIGKGLLEIGYEPWHAEMHEREIDQVIATKQSIRGEVSFPHATLGRRIYDYIFSPVINQQGQVEGIAGTTRDITDIKLTEKILAESEMRFRTMAEGTNIYIIVANESGRAEYFNQAWDKLTGRTVNELINNGWTDLLHPQDLERFNMAYQHAYQSQTPFHCDFRVLSQDGQYKWLLTDGSVRRNSDDSFAGFISASIDITELKENEQRKNDFISMVSHELKTPLTSALAHVQISKKRSVENGDPVSPGMLERAEKQLFKMGRLINGFLNLSRLQSGKIQIDRELFDMSLLLQEVQDEVLSSVTTHKVVFTSCPKISVNGDRDKIGQVIQNLISNAVKYSPPHSFIKVACDADKESVKVGVTDEGIGISEDDLSRLFERFYRVKDAERRHIAGFGIGLYLSAEIIKRHGGQIWAESVLGKGSSFYFTIPVASGQNQ